MNTLLIIDVQNDFCPGGALAVPEGDQIVPLINRAMAQFDCVVATQDWHPADHVSFAANHPGRSVGEVIEVDTLTQVLWPVHCVQESEGAALHPELDAAPLDKTVRKGTDAAIDSYSAFFDNGRRKQTELDGWLKAKGITALTICGLATDYCVKWTVLDALELGYDVKLAQDACRGVELNAGDVDKAIAEMKERGAEIIEWNDAT